MNQHTFIKPTVHENASPGLLLGQKSDPFSRLAGTSKQEKDLKHVDSLDLALMSEYNHHTQWGAPRSQVLLTGKSTWFHSQTCSKGSETLQGKGPVPTPQEMILYREKYRNYLEHVELRITANHVSTSHRGYSRSMDGVFFIL